MKLEAKMKLQSLLIVLMLTSPLAFAPGCSNSSGNKEAELRLEVERLKLELEKAKLAAKGGNTGAVTDKASESFLEVPSAGMSEKAFIEWHRNYQTTHDSKSDELKYKDFMERHKDNPVYFYLHARLLDEMGRGQKLEAGEKMVNAWPKFPYGHNFYGYTLAFEKADYALGLKHMREA